MLAVCGENYKEQVPRFEEGVTTTTHITKKEHVDTLREKGDLLMNQLPLLCIDGMKLVQSGAIIRYLAKKHNLCGSDGTVEQEVMCDMLNESITDWRKYSGVVAFEFTLSYEPTEEQMSKLAIGNAKYLPLFERRLRQNNNKNDDSDSDGNTGTKGLFLVGNTYTYPDFRLWEFLEEIEPHETFEKYPLMKAYHREMKEHKVLKAFMASDKRKSKTQDGIDEYKKTVMTTLDF